MFVHRLKKKNCFPFFSALVLLYVGQHLTLLSSLCKLITKCQNNLTLLFADRSKETDA